MSDDIEVRVAVLEEHRGSTDEKIGILFDRLIKHMDKEEGAFKALYKKLGEIEREISSSFKERDEKFNAALAERDAKIVTLDKKIVKIIAWMSAAYVVAGIAVQVGFNLYFGG